MILAAGRGERLRPLTDETPKPLIDVGGKPLIQWHLEALARAGFRDVVINLGWQGDRLRRALGDDAGLGLRLHWSDEQDVPGALETGGGIHRALPLLGDGPFLVVSGDTWTDYDLTRLRAAKVELAHLVLVPNPPHHPEGDFLLRGGRVRDRGDGPRYTFGGIAVFHPRFFHGCEAGRYRLAPLLREHMESGTVTGELHRGAWFDPGTPERLDALRERLAGQRA